MRTITIQGYRIILKPSMVMILSAAVIGVSGVFLLGAYPKVFEAPPSYGYLAPNSWKFECRAPASAKAEATSRYDASKGVDTAKDADHNQYRLDMAQGVTVDISKPGPSPDYVYLRNGLNLEKLRQRGTSALTFEAKAEKPFPVLFTIRDNKNLLWRQGTNIEGDWKPYRMTVPSDNIAEAQKVMVIFSAQLGGKQGQVSLKNIALK